MRANRHPQAQFPNTTPIPRTLGINSTAHNPEFAIITNIDAAAELAVGNNSLYGSTTDRLVAPFVSWYTFLLALMGFSS
jgi:hypothetical protein